MTTPVPATVMASVTTSATTSITALVTTSTTASISEGCGVLEVDVDLEALVPVTVERAGPWSLDWSALTTSGLGNTFVPTEVSEVMLARYSLTPAELAEQFFDLEALAAETWRLDHKGGSTSDLSLLTTSKGEAFSGFDEKSNYILALRCGSCPTPAPLFMTILTVN